jgi:hypothetical protein
MRFKIVKTFPIISLSIMVLLSIFYQGDMLNELMKTQQIQRATEKKGEGSNDCEWQVNWERK